MKVLKAFLNKDIETISLSKEADILCRIDKGLVCVLNRKMPFVVIDGEMVFSYIHKDLGEYKLAIQDKDKIYPIAEKALKYLGELLDTKISFKDYNDIPIAMAIAIADNLPNDIKLNMENGIITSFSKKNVYPEKELASNLISEMNEIGFPLYDWKVKKDGDYFSFKKGSLEIVACNSRKVGKNSELIAYVSTGAKKEEIKKIKKHSERGKALSSFRREINEMQEFLIKGENNYV